MFHKPAHKDTDHPPGQIVNPLVNFETPLIYSIEDWIDEQKKVMESITELRDAQENP